MTRLFRKLEGNVLFPAGSVVCIGAFDGVHLGHRALLRHTARRAAALGVPAVAVAVVPAQQPTVRGLARRRAVVDGGALYTADAPARISRVASALIAAPARCDALARTARQLVDGRGAERIAAALRRLAAGRTSHA